MCQTIQQVCHFTYYEVPSNNFQDKQNCFSVKLNSFFKKYYTVKIPVTHLKTSPNSLNILTNTMHTG